MLFSQSHKLLAKIPPKDAGRFSGMNGLRLERLPLPGSDPADLRGALVATDGRCLVALPVELAPHDTDGPVTLEAFQAACKARGYVGRLTANGALEVYGGPTFPRPKAEDATFPEWRRILANVPKLGDPDTVSLTLSAALLAKLRDACSNDGDEKLVTVTFRTDACEKGGRINSTDPMLVSSALLGTDAVCVLMPASRDDLPKAQEAPIPT